MKAKGALLWIFPALTIISAVVFYSLPKTLKRADQSLWERKYKGWTWDLESFADGGRGGTDGQRTGDMAIAPDGSIWVAGSGMGLTGLHWYDGSQWHHQPGEYTDLAVGPNGEVWAAPIQGSSMQVFDGKQWKTYPISGLARDLSYPQVEIDARGRAWYVSDAYGEAWLGELSIKDGAITALDPAAPLRVQPGWIASLDANPQGGLWAALHTSWVEPPAPDDDLDFFDGKTWQKVDVPGAGSVTRTVFDSQGDAWILTGGGSVMHYIGDGWETVVHAPRSGELDGLFVDPKGRLWIWAGHELRFLEGGKWTALTPRNSGIVGSEGEGNVFGVVVDKQDRAWIGTSNGVSSARLGDIQPLSEAESRDHEALQSSLQQAESVWWAVPSVFALLWLAAALGVLPGVLLGAVLGMGTIVWRRLDPLWVIPGLGAMYLGMLCGLFFGLTDEKRKSAGSTRRGMVPALVGWLVGLVVGPVLFYLLIISHTT